MSGVEQHRVSGGIEYSMDREGEFHCAEIGTKVTPCARHLLD
jgi:hypothetical protein